MGASALRRVASTTTNGSMVPVRFSDAYRSKNVMFLLVRDRGTWKIDDVHCKGVPTFRQLLTDRFPK